MGRRLTQTERALSCSPPRSAVPRAPGEKEVEDLGALGLCPDRGGDSQARDCLQMHPGAMGEAHEGDAEGTK